MIYFYPMLRASIVLVKVLEEQPERPKEYAEWQVQLQSNFRYGAQPERMEQEGDNSESKVAKQIQIPVTCSPFSGPI